MIQHNFVFRNHSEKSSVIFLTTKIKEKLCFYNCCKSAHLWWYKKVNIAWIECGRVYYINKRKNAIRISLVFLSLKLFSTVVFVVNFGDINFIGHVQAHELFITMLSVDGMSLANIPFNKYFKFINKIHDMYAEKILSYLMNTNLNFSQ